MRSRRVGVGRQLDRVADRERSTLERADVDPQVAQALLRVGDPDTASPARMVPVSPIWPPDSP